jgi:alpha-galactosidase/6-phospho-beta-glucosidase family protein
MTEIEVPLEKVQEDIHHQAQHSKDRFMLQSALLSALLAVLAAIAALLGGHYANESMLEQIQSSDHWAYYQAKGIKASLTEMKQMSAKDDESAKRFSEQIEKYKAEQEEIKAEAEHKEHESKHALHLHELFAKAVTFFQVAIALTAIAVLVRRPHFVWGSIGLGFAGAVFFVMGLAQAFT